MHWKLILKSFGCWFGIHAWGAWQRGSIMTRRGPRYVYQCKKCGRFWSELGNEH